MGTEVLNCFTVDLEDYFHICGLPEYCDVNRWDRLPSRVENNTRRILDLLDRHGVKATFFVLGWIAEKYPELVKEVAAKGHEIASHGYAHRLVYEMTPDEFRDDLKRSMDIIESTVGQKVLGFRATSFSIMKNSLWALDTIAQLGFVYDASIFPALRDHGGIIGEKRFPHQRTCSGGKVLWEFPMSTVKIFGRMTAFSGGGYLRLFPIGWVRKWVEALNAGGHPAVFYIHPRDLDPDQPRLKMSLIRRFKSYVNLSGAEAKLDVLMSHFPFCPIRDVIGDE